MDNNYKNNKIGSNILFAHSKTDLEFIAHLIKLLKLITYEYIKKILYDSLTSTEFFLTFSRSFKNCSIKLHLPGQTVSICK